MPDFSDIFGGQFVNQDLLDKASERVSGALSTARDTRAKARESFGTSVADTVRAIDETVADLRKSHDSQWNLPLLAFGAGMLRTTPGVASNFGNEVGSGLASAVPAISNARMQDRDFWAKIADLQSQRGTMASLPAKMDIEQSNKEIEDLTRGQSSLEAAGIRGIPASQRLADQRTKLEEQLNAKRQDQLSKMQNEARSDVKEMLKNFEGAQPEDIDALQQMVLHDRIQKFNAQPGQDIKLTIPDMTPDQIARANKVRGNMQKKGLDEYRSKLRAGLVAKADASLKMQYPAFGSLDPDAQESLRQEQINRLIEENNKSTSKDAEPYLPTTTFTPEEWNGINSAKAQHARLVKIGEPTKGEVEDAHLPSDLMPQKYKNLSYPERQKTLAREDEHAKKELEPLILSANELPRRLMMADEFMRDYDASNRTGIIGGITRAIGSEQAQRLDKISSELAMTNVPKGQGAISDAERALIMKSNPSRAMERGAAQTLVNFYKEASMRSNEQLQFFRTWQDHYKTTDGAMEAWNNYINSPQGSILKTKKGGEGGMELNPRRMTWREYFDRKNKGDLANEIWERDSSGKLVKKKSD